MEVPTPPIVKMEFGSTLYGTRVPTSDTDVKGIFLPTAEQILLGTMPQAINRKVDGDDQEFYSLVKFFDLCASGQTVAMEMLFAPQERWLAWTRLWPHIVANREYLVTRRAAGFVDYCRKQAAKYGVKGDRLRAVEKIIGILHPFCVGIGEQHLLPLGSINYRFEPEVDKSEFWAIKDILMPGGKTIPHLSVCERMVPYTASIKTAYETFKRIHDEYGQRAHAAATGEGIDWKALMHAVRIGNEAVELLSTGVITLPRPEAPRLLAIRTGQVPYAEVAEEIETLLAQAESLSATSTLPEDVDHEWIRHTIYQQHRYRVTGRSD